MEEAFEALPPAANGAAAAAPLAQPTHSVPAKQARHSGHAHAATASAETMDAQLAEEGPPPARQGDCMVFVSAPFPSALLQFVCNPALGLAGRFPGSCPCFRPHSFRCIRSCGFAGGLGSVLVHDVLCCSS